MRVMSQVRIGRYVNVSERHGFFSYGQIAHLRHQIDQCLRGNFITFWETTTIIWQSTVIYLFFSFGLADRQDLPLSDFSCCFFCRR